MPVLYDSCLQVSISFLKRYGYLNSNQWKSGIITWSRGEGEQKEITAQISISVNTHGNPYLELNYKQNGKPVSYRVQFVSIPSNIGRGVVWFFSCPHTGKRCRKIYLVSERFLHREAFKGCMYEKQIRSKRWRLLDKVFSTETILEQQGKPYFKTHYNGKPTKRYQKMLNLENLLQGISPADLFWF